MRPAVATARRGAGPGTVVAAALTAAILASGGTVVAKVGDGPSFVEAVVAARPERLEVRLGEQGVLLSGGERQRVGIARALYHEPDVLVLDEATAALDIPTEIALSAAIDALHGEKTVLVIAHRLSTVLRCDRIALVVDGRLVDCGTVDELQARNETFRRLAHGDSPPHLEAGSRR